LPDGDQATRQMNVSPSLLRILALSKKKGGPWKVAAALLLVAVVGGLASFWAVRLHRRRVTPVATTVEAPAPVEPEAEPETYYGPEPAPPASVPATIAKAPAAPPVAPPAVKPAPVAPVAAAKAKPPKVAAARPVHLAGDHVAVAIPPVPKQKHLAPGALPHKQVSTDSQSKTQQDQKQASLVLPVAAKETVSTPAPAPAQTEAAAKQEAEAGVDADSVRLVVRHHLPQVRACYSRAFKDASPGGTVEIGFAIDPAGRAQNVRAETNTTSSDELARCLEARVREWQFPRPVGGDFELIYPFVFAPGS
jgi:hypothetical protein